MRGTYLRRSPSPAGRDLITECAECEAQTTAAGRLAAEPPVVRSYAGRLPLVPLLQSQYQPFFGAQFIAMAATEELSGILSRRQQINDKLEEGLEVKPKYKFVNVYTEFHEFTRKEIKQYEETFNK